MQRDFFDFFGFFFGATFFFAAFFFAAFFFTLFFAISPPWLTTTPRHEQ